MYLGRRTYEVIKDQLKSSVKPGTFNDVCKCLRWVIENGDVSNYKYNKFWINKETGEYIFDKKVVKQLENLGTESRPINSPSAMLKEDCQLLAEMMIVFTSGLYWIKGFNYNESVITNGIYHQRNGARYCINMDLKGAFNQVTARNIKDFGRYCMGWNKKVSKKFSKMMTVKGQMVQGNPLSPLLLNLFCAEMDSLLLNYCKGNGIFYTRYADDLTFTSKTPITDTQHRLIMNIISYCKFKVKKSKTKFYKGLIEITGVRIRGKHHFRTGNRKKLKSDVRALQGLLDKRGYEYLERTGKDGLPISTKHVIKGIKLWLNQTNVTPRRKQKQRKKLQKWIKEQTDLLLQKQENASKISNPAKVEKVEKLIRPSKKLASPEETELWFCQSSYAMMSCAKSMSS